MKISKEQVEHIAQLSRINLSEEEKNTFSQQLSNIIEYVEKLNELDTTDVEPLAGAVTLNNIFRDDIVKKSIEVDKALANAPDRQGNFFKVPKIIE